MLAMLWTKQQQDLLDNFISEIKNVQWFQNVGQLSEKYMVVDTIWEACDTYGKQMCEVWGQNSENIEKESQKYISNEQIDSVFEAVSLAIGNEVYEALCNMEDRIGEETGEDQSGVENEILDFIKRDTAWACIERIIGQKGFFNQVYDINRTGRWACSWVGAFPAGNFIIM